jgi:hypothetical protein
MAYTVEMSPKAEKELYKAWAWYEEEQPGLGRRFQNEFFRKIGLIKIILFIIHKKRVARGND